MTIELSQYVSSGVPYVRLQCALGALSGVAPSGWADLPQTSVVYRAFMNASIQALTIDVDSDWPWVGIAGPALTTLAPTGPAPNSGLATVGSPLLSEIVSAGVTGAQRVDPFLGNGTIAVITANPLDIMSSLANFPIDPSKAAFYNYWDANQTTNPGSFAALQLRCTAWFAPLPPISSYPMRRFEWRAARTANLTGGGATDIIGKVPMFGREGCRISSPGTFVAGDTVNIVGVTFDSTNVTKVTITSFLTPAAGWSIAIYNNKWDAIEVQYSKVAAGAGSLRLDAVAWDK